MNPKPDYAVGDILEIKIEKIVPQGLGLAFAENLTVFVPLSVPGDRLRVRLTRLKKRTAFADIITVLESSPKRIEPPCPYFGNCGGCDFQQMSYALQVQAKIDMLRDCLLRLGKINFEGEIKTIRSPEAFGYRSRARWHLDRKSRSIGYFKHDSHKVVDIAECLVLTPDMQSALEYLRLSTDWDVMWDDRAEVEAASGDNGQISIFSRQAVTTTSDVSVSVGAEKYLFSAETFFQGNIFLGGELVKAAIGGAQGESAIDLYCGVGLFTVPLARNFLRVTGVEGNEKAVEFARKNIARIHAANVEFEIQSVGKYLDGRGDDSVDFLLLDPPRSGVEKGTIKKITSIKPAEISYVSCEPSMLARDLSEIVAAGYKIESITAVDLFPQTHHVETVVRLRADSGTPAPLPASLHS